MPQRQASWKPRKRGLRWPRIVATAGGLGLVIALAIIILPLTGSKVQDALRIGHLARIPDKAIGLQYDGTRSLFSAAYVLRFSASGSIIDEFVRQSPGLSRLTAEALSPEHMCLPDTERDPAATGTGPHVYFHPDERYPWFTPTVRDKGRRFVLPPDANGGSGEVVIDDEAHIVYIRVARS